MIRSTLRIAVLSIAAAALAGCTSYYKVSDPTSGHTYYTTKLEKMRDGAVRLEDQRTKTEVTIQNSHVQKLTKEEYQAGLISSPTTRGM